jgi:hypothetical protein
MREFLVFFRAGAKSLHGEALAGDPNRNWDCCVSWYSKPAPTEALAEYYVEGGKNKLDAFADAYKNTFAALPYRWLLVVDDDVRFKPGDISRMFEIAARDRLDLSQPALAWGTNSNFDLTLWNPACVVRRVRWVEVMAPCFAKTAIDKLLPTFYLTTSTWGADYAWAALLGEASRIGIIDEIQVEHTKPADVANGPFYLYLRRMGVDAAAELDDIRRQYPVHNPLVTFDFGHWYRWPLPRSVNRKLMWLLEKRKGGYHRKRLAANRQAAV